MIRHIDNFTIHLNNNCGRNVSNFQVLLILDEITMTNSTLSLLYFIFHNVLRNEIFDSLLLLNIIITIF
jgi:hypothetical protein